MKAEIQEDNLPTDWSVVDLGDLLERITNGLTCEQEKEPPGIPVTRIESISNGVVDFERVRYVRDLDETKRARFLLQRGDILFSHINSDLHLGKTAVVTSDKPLLHGMNLLLLRTKKERLDPYYLHYLLNYYRRSGAFMAIAQHAVNQSSLNQKKINSLKVPLAPLDQQKRIVAEIEKQFSRLDEAIVNLKRVKANLKRYKAAVLKAAVEGRLTEAWRNLHPDVEPASELLKRILVDRRAKWEETELVKMGMKDMTPKDEKWREKYSEPVSTDTYSLEELPRNWVWGTWDQISNWVTYGFTRPMPHVEVGIPIVTAKHVANGKIDLINTHKTPMEKYEELSDKDRPKPGDILITKDGTIGRAAIVPKHSGFCINQSVAIIWLRSCPMYRKFLLAVIESDLTQKPIWAKARGVAIQHLSITDFARLPLPIPPLREQEEIVTVIESRLSVIDEVESVANANLQRADRFRQSILSRAFSGQLIREEPQTQRRIERAVS